MSGDREFLDKIRREMDRQVESQSPQLQGELRAVRREALEKANRKAPARFRLVAFAASLFVVVTTSVIWFQSVDFPVVDTEVSLQTAGANDLLLLHEGDDLELYRDLEFYYWLQQQAPAHAG